MSKVGKMVSSVVRRAVPEFSGQLYLVLWFISYTYTLFSYGKMVCKSTVSRNDICKINNGYMYVDCHWSNYAASHHLFLLNWAGLHCHYCLLQHICFLNLRTGRKLVCSRIVYFSHNKEQLNAYLKHAIPVSAKKVNTMKCLGWLQSEDWW